MTNWPTKKLGEVCEISAGGSAPQGERFFENGKYPFFRTSDVGVVHLSDNLCDVRDYLNDQGIKKLNLFKKGTILFPKSGASTFLNHRVIMGCDGYVASHLATIFAGEKIDFKYLYFFLILIDAKDIAPNSSYPSLRIADIAKIKIPLPLIGEQKKIVAKLERVLAKISEAKKLRAEARENTGNLFSAELHKIFEEGKKKGWEEKELGRVCELNMGQSPSSSTYNTSKVGLPFYQGKKDYGEKYPTPRVWCSDPIKIVETEDILISVRAPVGALNIVKEKSCIGRGLAGLRADKELYQYFLYYFLKLKQRDISDMGTGSTFTAISKKHLENLEIPLPTIGEQKKIVERLDSLSEKIKKLQEYQKTAQSDFLALEQSVLSRAFSEKL